MLGTPGAPRSLVSSMPNSFDPGVRRRSSINPFLYAALPPPLIPFIDLVLPVGRKHLLRCPLQIIGVVGGANCMIFAAKRVRSISARGENVLFQTRDIGHMMSLRPFKAGAAGRPIDREEQARSELQSCVYRGPLRQAVLDMVQQYLRNRYLERSGIALLGTSSVSNSCWKDAG
jgi:hypothetical protein